MTIENCISLLKAYKKQADFPVGDSGIPLSGEEKTNVIAQSLKNYEAMKKHILSSRKFKGHSIIAELQEIKPAEEIIEDGKKSKR